MVMITQLRKGRVNPWIYVINAVRGAQSPGGRRDISSPCHCDQLTDKKHRKEDFIWVHGFRGYGPCWQGRQGCGRRQQLDHVFRKQSGVKVRGRARL